MVYEVADHGPTGMLIHPNFPTTPFIYIYYTADPANYWDDSCTLPPDPEGFSYCNVTQRLHRFDLAVTMTGTRCTNFALAGSAVLMEDWCTSGASHGNGNIEWYDGANMILTSGDGAVASQTDYGQRIGDVCTDPAKQLPQGRYRSQRSDYLHGKLLLFKAASLLKTTKLVIGTDYNIVAVGLRQAYVNTVNPWTLDVLVGDVGSKVWEEVNVITRREMLNPSLWPLNFGWPCLEGRVDQAPLTVGDIAWFQNECNKTAGELCDICSTIYPCKNGVNSPGCSSSYRPPAFQFRDTIDRDNSALCQSATHAIVGLTWIQGSDFSPEAAAVLPFALLGMDIGSGCIFYWDVDPTTKRVLFEDGASVFATGHEGGLFLTRGRGGSVYSGKTDAKDTLYRFGLIGGIVSPSPPIANMATFLFNPTTNAYAKIDCRNGCSVSAGSKVMFDGSGSTVMPGSAAIASYRMEYGDMTGAAKQALPLFVKQYTASGAFRPIMFVTDTSALVDYDAVKINVRTAPVAITMTPASGAWKIGQTISYQLTGLTLADVKSSKWDATVSHCRFNQCTGGVDCHLHTNGVDAGGSALAGKLTPPGHAMPSSMTITASVTPITGTPFVVSAETTALQYATTVRAAVGGVVREGWPVEVVDISTCFSPCTISYMAGISSELVAPKIMYRAGRVHTFVVWAAGAVTSVTGSIPIVADGMTLTAKYNPITVGANTAAGPVLLGGTGYYGFIEVKWTAPVAGGYDIILINVVADDGTDRGVAAIATDRRAVVSVPAGASTYTVKLAGYSSPAMTKSVFGPSLSVRSSDDPAMTCYAQSSPYGGTVPAIPGTIHFERFDQGGEGTAYHDLTAGNTGGATYRSSSDVDIAVVGISQYAVTQADAGEWLQFTASVMVAGGYTFTFYLASTVATKKTIYVMVDAAACVQANAVVVYQQSGSTGGAVVVYPAAAVVPLPAGEHTLTLCVATAGLMLDKMVIAAAA